MLCLCRVATACPHRLMMNDKEGRCWFHVLSVIRFLFFLNMYRTVLTHSDVWCTPPSHNSVLFGESQMFPPLAWAHNLWSVRWWQRSSKEHMTCNEMSPEDFVLVNLILWVTEARRKSYLSIPSPKLWEWTLLNIPKKKKLELFWKKQVDFILDKQKESLNQILWKLKIGVVI